MNKELIIYLCGFHSLGFAIFHLYFWRLFRWNTDQQKISKPNKGIIQIENVQLIIVFLFTSFICFYLPQDLYTTRLGKAFLFGGVCFWLVRIAAQFVFLKNNHPLIHLLTLLFVLGALLFLLPLI